MNIKLLASAILMLSFSASAGTYDSKQPMLPPKSPVEECYDLGGYVEVGYMSDHIIHGLRVNRDAAYAEVGYEFQAILPLRFSAAYTSGINNVYPFGYVGPIDTTDLAISTRFENVGGFDIELGYLHRFVDFSQLGNLSLDYSEVNLDIRRSLGFVDFVIGTTVGIESCDSFFNNGDCSGWAHYAGLEKTISLCDAADLILAGGVGYHDGFFLAGASDWSHYYLNASLPIKLNCRTTLTPYIGYNAVQQWNVYAPQGDALHGGVSLNVAF